MIRVCIWHFMKALKNAKQIIISQRSSLDFTALRMSFEEIWGQKNRRVRAEAEARSAGAHSFGAFLGRCQPGMDFCPRARQIDKASAGALTVIVEPAAT